MPKHETHRFDASPAGQTTRNKWGCMEKIRLVIRAVGWYCSFMHTLTIKIPPQLEAEILQASAQDHLSKSELVRRALDFYLRQRKSVPPFVSALDQAGDLVGCFSGVPPDLSSNPEHLASFGRD